MMKKINVKPPIMKFVRDDQKTLECRMGYPHIRRIKVDDLVEMRSNDNFLIIKIKAIRSYKNLKEVIQNEPIEKLAPGLTAEMIIRLGRDIFPEQKVRVYGLVIFEFQRTD